MHLFRSLQIVVVCLKQGAVDRRGEKRELDGMIEGKRDAGEAKCVSGGRGRDIEE